MVLWHLIIWIGTTTNFQILHTTYSEKLCEKEKAVWEITLNNVQNRNLECTNDFREGRSMYQKKNSIGFSK
jgi:hypothetical protein